MTYAFQLHWKEGKGYMPEPLFKLVACLNKRTWREFSAGTLMVEGVSIRRDKPPVVFFIARPEGWLVAGRQPYVLKDFHRALTELEETVRITPPEEESPE